MLKSLAVFLLVLLIGCSKSEIKTNQSDVEFPVIKPEAEEPLETKISTPPPNLVELFDLPPNSISIPALLAMDTIYQIERLRQSALLYFADDDIWFPYEFITGYEDLGYIRKVDGYGELLLITLEKGSIVAKGNKVLHFSNHLLPAGFKDGKFISMENARDYVSNHIIFLDSSNFSYSKVRLNKGIFMANNCVIQDSVIWVSSVEDVGDYGFLAQIFNVSLDGNSNSIYMENVDYYQFIVDIFPSGDSLFAATQMGIYTLNNKVPFKRKTKIWGGGYQLTKADESSIYYLRNDPGENSVKLLTLDKATLSLDSTTIKLQPNTLSKNSFYGFEIVNGEIHAYTTRNVLGIDNESGEEFVYKFDAKEPSFFFNHIEDEDAIWFLSTENGLSSFSKDSNTWSHYPNILHLKNKPHKKVSSESLTMNEDYVFVSLTLDDSLQTKQFLIFDKGTHEGEILNEEQLRQHFFFKNGQFARYDGKPFCDSSDSELVRGVFDQIDIWTSLLYFYELPIPPNHPSNGIVNNDFLNAIAFDPDKIQSNRGIYILSQEKETNSFGVHDLSKFSFSPEIKLFLAPSRDLKIVGSEEKLYIISNGPNPEYLYTVNLYSKEINKIEIPFTTELINGISIYEEMGNYIVIGGGYGEIFSYDKTSKKLELHQFTGNLTKAYYGENYIFIGTDENILFFNKQFEIRGNLLREIPRNSDVTISKYGIYVYDEDKISIVR